MKVSLQKVQVQNLGKRYENHWALHGINADFDTGQISLLLGQNGSGKSTLLALLSTLLHPSQGEIFYDGIPLKHIQEDTLRSSLSLLAHEPRLYGNFTALENLQFFASLYGFSAEEQKKHIGIWIETFQLVPFLHRQVQTLSRGMKQKVALARTFLTNPSLLLLDEPYSHLDLTGKEILTNCIQSHCQQGAIILVATHDIEQVSSLCHQALVLEKGNLKSCENFSPGSPNQASLFSFLQRKQGENEK